MYSLAHVILLVGAGVVAGVMGSAGGITSLVSYPALLAVGIAPLPANVTNVVALVGSFPGSALGSRPELRGQMRWLRRWAPLAGAGAVLGVVLLLLTSDHLFNRLVPFLLLATALLLLVQPRISRWHRARDGRGGDFILGGGIFAMSVYSGYFGAGSGIMMLALLLITLDERYAISNALKNMMVGVATVVAAVGFLLFGPVRIEAALYLGAGLLVGSFLGPKAARRLPGDVLRLLAAALGIGLAIWLFVSPGS
ncbi:MAG: sulfite exporter TauE/SafE family protein [Acidimicrobiales bacterium]